MKTLFELAFRDQRKLNAFIKTCEAMTAHSDTALFKVKTRGVYILLTDFESLCCLETRLTENIKNMLKMNCSEFTAKILLDSLTNILRKIARNKHSAILYADSEKPQTLQIKETIGQSHRTVEQYTVESTEHRARVYYVLSTNEFREKSKDYLQFRIPNVEFNKIITMQSILSGNNGGVGEIVVTPVPDEPDQPKSRVEIKFFLKNQSGAMGGVTIHSRCGDDSLSVPVQHIPKETIRTQYFLTYLKRSQTMFTVPSDFVTLLISEKGILVQTDPKENNHYIVIFLSDISDLDLDSFV